MKRNYLVILTAVMLALYSTGGSVRASDTEQGKIHHDHEKSHQATGVTKELHNLNDQVAQYEKLIPTQAVEFIKKCRNSALLETILRKEARILLRDHLVSRISELKG